MSAENALTKEEVLPQLWSEYCKDKEFLLGGDKGIRRNHPIVLKREEDGLLRVVKKYVEKSAYKKSESPIEIVNMIKDMHDILFKYVFPIRGKYRDEQKRIGDFYDESLKLALPKEISPKMTEYAGWLSRLNIDNLEYLDKCFTLADIHLKLVMIHPFMDGNGRISRAVTDMYAVKMGLPPAINSYPRANKEQQRHYHEAIKLSRMNNDSKPLALWIKSYLDRIIEKLA